MSSPDQSVCATQPAIQNRKKRAGRPRSSRKKRTRRMENEIASKKVIARSPWFGMINRNLPFLAGLHASRHAFYAKVEPVSKTTNRKAPHGYKGNSPPRGDRLQI